MRISSQKKFRVSIFRLAAVMASLCALMLCAMSLGAQSTNGAIQGTVTDSSGGVVPNANVTARNTSTGVERTTQTDSSGQYSIPSLPSGSYNVEIQALGLQKQVIQDIQVEVSRTLAINAQLKVGVTSEVLTVTGETPVIDSSTRPGWATQPPS